jgi:hypothetical protein
MILAYDNLFKTATLSVTSEDASYPIEHVYHKWKKNIFKSQEDVLTTTITLTFDEPKDINSFFILYHNCDSKTVVFKDDIDAEIETWTVTGDAYHDEVKDVYSVEITLTAPVTIYVGAMFLGASIEASKDADTGVPLMSTDVPTFSSDYQVSGRKGSVLRGANISIPSLSSTEREAIEDAFYECGTLYPFFLDLWQLTPDKFEPLYGVFASGLTVTHTEQGDIVSFDFQEVN